MSSKHIENFQNQVKSDPTLQAKLSALQGEKDRGVLTQKIAEIGRSHGHEVSAAEVDSYLKSAVKGAELSDDSLKSVAGGAGTKLGGWTYSWPGCN
jgi:predicted ribosomally synthesized peptide with nif11-like leader